MATGTDDLDLADQAIALGAHGYLHKPFNPTDLTITVANALRTRRCEIENRERPDGRELV